MEEKVSTTVEMMKGMTQEERREFIRKLSDAYCPQCGRDQADMYPGCQCWNDE